MNTLPHCDPSFGFSVTCFQNKCIRTGTIWQRSSQQQVLVLYSFCDKGPRINRCHLKKTYSAFFVFSFLPWFIVSLVHCYIGSCACKRFWKSVGTNRIFFHYTMLRVTHSCYLSLLATLACKTWLSTAALLKLVVLGQTLPSDQSKERVFNRGGLKRWSVQNRLLTWKFAYYVSLKLIK